MMKNLLTPTLLLVVLWLPEELHASITESCDEIVLNQPTEATTTIPISYGSWYRKFLKQAWAQLDLNIDSPNALELTEPDATSITLSFTTPEVYIPPSLKPKFKKRASALSYLEAQEAQRARMFILKMGELGYEHTGSKWISNHELNLEFKRRSELVRSADIKEIPDYVAIQKDQLNSWYEHETLHLGANEQERNFSVNPTGFILSRETISSLVPGLYSFVVLQNEQFLRLGPGHPGLGAKEAAAAAGDIFIARNPLSGKNEVVFISNRSDTYQPPAWSMTMAVRALWKQAIFPQHLELRNWNNRDVFLVLDSQIGE